MKKIIEFSGKVKRVNITVKGIEVETEDEFKDGDFVKLNGGSIIIFNDTNISKQLFYHAYLTDNGCLGISGGKPSHYGYTDSIIGFATPIEKQKLLDALKKEGKVWNAEKKRIEPYRWRAEKRGTYYYIAPPMVVGEGLEYYDDTDNSLYEAGNYFQTEEEAEKAIEKIKQIFKS